MMQIAQFHLKKYDSLLHFSNFSNFVHFCSSLNNEWKLSLVYIMCTRVALLYTF
jgi:hypothetical protein